MIPEVFSELICTKGACDLDKRLFFFSGIMPSMCGFDQALRDGRVALGFGLDETSPTAGLCLRSLVTNRMRDLCLAI